jgi:serine protease Do
MNTNRLRRLLPAALLVAAGIAAGAWFTARFGRMPMSYKEISAVAASENVPAVSFQNGFEATVQKALPSVVSITSTKVVRSRAVQNPFDMDPFFRQFFGNSRMGPAPEREQREHGLGSGVIISQDGYILTNNHVVEGADELKVTLGDQRIFPAKVIGTDKRTDLAVVKIDAANLPAIALADSDQVKIGQFALAIGNPFGVGRTVTMGIVSATGRGGLGIEDYEDFIQTDAAINPGNSGGALVNVNGELIGINTAILTEGSGGNQGVGFAIPVNMAKNVEEQIIKNGKVIRGWLGVSVQPVTPEIAQSLKVAKAEGALIADVTKGSPAEKAGLKTGDIILALNGTPVPDSRGLSLRVAQLAPGSTATLKILRDGNTIEEKVVLGEFPSGRESAASTPESGGGPRLGISVQPLTPEIARQLGVPESTQGLAITDVASGSAAAEAGLRTGDIIQEVNRKPVRTAADLQEAVRAAGKQPVLLLVNRNGNRSFIPVTPR